MLKFSLFLVILLLPNIIKAQSCNVKSTQDYSTSSSKTSIFMAMEVDSSGNVYYLYADTNKQNSNLLVLRLKMYSPATNTWTFLGNVITDSCKNIAKMALCKALVNSSISYTPHVFFTGDIAGSSYVKYFNGISWITKINNGVTNNAVSPSIIKPLDIKWNTFNNTISILYLTNNTPNDLFYFEYSLTNTWNSIGSGGLTDVDDAKLQIEKKTGYPYIAYRQIGQLNFYEFNGSMWQSIPNSPFIYPFDYNFTMGDTIGNFTVTFIDDGIIKGYTYDKNKVSINKFDTLVNMTINNLSDMAMPDYASDSSYSLTLIVDDSIKIYQKFESQKFWTLTTSTSGIVAAVQPSIACTYNSFIASNALYIGAQGKDDDDDVNNIGSSYIDRSSPSNPVIKATATSTINLINTVASSTIANNTYTNPVLEASTIDKNGIIHYLYTNKLNQLFYIYDFKKSNPLAINTPQYIDSVSETNSKKISITVTENLVPIVTYISNTDKIKIKKQLVSTWVDIAPTSIVPQDIYNDFELTSGKQDSIFLVFSNQTGNNTAITVCNTALGSTGWSSPYTLSGGTIKNLNLTTANNYTEVIIGHTFGASNTFYVFKYTVASNIATGSGPGALTFVDNLHLAVNYEQRAIVSYTKTIGLNTNLYLKELDLNTFTIQTILLPLNYASATITNCNAQADRVGNVYVNALLKSNTNESSDSLILFNITPNINFGNPILRVVNAATPVYYGSNFLLPIYSDSSNNLVTAVNGWRTFINSTAIINIPPSIKLCANNTINIASPLLGTYTGYNWFASLNQTNITNKILYGGIKSYSNYDIEFANVTSAQLSTTLKNFISANPNNIYVKNVGYNTCGIGIISKPIKLTPNAIPTGTTIILPNDTVCNGDSVILIFNLTSSLGIQTYTWSNPAITATNNASFLPDAFGTNPDTVILTVTDSNTCNVTYKLGVYAQMPDAIEGTVTLPNNNALFLGEAYIFKLGGTSNLLDTLIGQSLAYTPIVLGNYSAQPYYAGKYLLLAQSTDTFGTGFNSLMQTYYGGGFTWNDALNDTITIGCSNSSNTYNIQLRETSPGSIGPGNISGFVTEGVGFGNRFANPGYNQILGIPIKGVGVKLGREPGSNNNVERTGQTNSSGAYSFSNLPLASYKVFVDIPGLTQDSSYTISLTAAQASATNINYIADSISIFIDQTIGFNSNKINNFSLLIYPNPTTNILHIQFSVSTKEQVNLCMVDQNGRVVKHFYQNAILPNGEHSIMFNTDLIKLKNGIYFITGNIGNTQFNNQFIKN